MDRNYKCRIGYGDFRVATDSFSRCRLAKNHIHINRFTGAIVFILMRTCYFAANLRVWGAQFEKQQWRVKTDRFQAYVHQHVAQLQGQEITILTEEMLHLIGRTEGVFYFEGCFLYDAIAGRRIALSDGNSLRIELLFILIFISKTTEEAISDRTGANIAITGNVTDQTAFNKVAFKYKSGDLALWINGTEAELLPRLSHSHLT